MPTSFHAAFAERQVKDAAADLAAEIAGLQRFLASIPAVSADDADLHGIASASLAGAARIAAAAEKLKQRKAVCDAVRATVAAIG
jgi:hypothetical protein